MILPALHRRRPALSIWDLVSLIGIGATLGVFLSADSRQGRRSFRIAIPGCLNLSAQRINRDARTNHLKNYQPRSMFSTWIGVVLLFAFFGLLALVVIGASPRGDDLRGETGQGAGREAASRCRKKRPRRSRLMPGSIRAKGWCESRSNDAMKLTVAELAQKTPAPANPIATPAASPSPQSTAPAPASPASPASAAAQAPASPSPSAPGNPYRSRGKRHERFSTPEFFG